MLTLGAAEYTAACVIFLVLTCIIVPLRCYARLRSISRLAAEDWIMVTAWITLMLIFAGSFYELSIGLGQHVSNALTSKVLEQTLFCFFIAVILYSVTMCLARISIGILLYRLMPNKWTKGILLAAMALNISATMFLVGWTLGLCHPMSHFWMRWHNGSCKDKSFATVGYIHSGSSIAVDWTLSLLPAYVMYRSQLDKRTKIGTAIVLSLAVLASIATSVRLSKIHASIIAKVQDFTYTIIEVLIWSVCEMGLTIVAGCGATLRTLFVTPKKRAQSSDGTRGRPGRPRQPGDTVENWDPGLTICMVGTVDEESGNWTALASPIKKAAEVQIETIEEERSDSRAHLQQPRTDGLI